VDRLGGVAETAVAKALRIRSRLSRTARSGIPLTSDNRVGARGVESHLDFDRLGVDAEDGGASGAEQCHTGGSSENPSAHNGGGISDSAVDHPSAMEHTPRPELGFVELGSRRAVDDLRPKDEGGPTNVGP